jgi:hypothetical protein
LHGEAHYFRSDANNGAVFSPFIIKAIIIPTQALKRIRTSSTTNCNVTSRRVARRVRCGWCHPEPVRKFAEQLMSQQLWCWGRDIKSPQGNLLMQYGFERHREPGKGSSGSTCYRLDDGPLHLALWGFGLFYGERSSGGLFVGRYDFRPRWANLESLSSAVHYPDDLPPFGRPSGVRQWKAAHRLCRNMLDWIINYEHWVQQEAGLPFRQRCIKSWLHPFVSAEKIPAAWSLLRNRCWDQQMNQWYVAVDRLGVLYNKGKQS